MTGVYIVLTSLGSVRGETSGFLMRVVQDTRFEIVRDWVRGKPSEHARCSAIKKFLQEPKLGDWLFFVDNDIEPPSNILDLVEIAEKEGIKIISGLYHTFQFEVPFPLVFKKVKADSFDGIAYQVKNPIPVNQLTEVDATGAGCLLIHREVLESFAKAKIPPFHREFNDSGQVVRGEDVFFCKKAQEVFGYKIYVHTGYICGHYKTINIARVAQLLADVQIKSMAHTSPQRYWDVIWSREDDRFYPELYPYVQEMIPEKASVLDIGCGTGTFLSSLEGRDRYGVDISNIAIKKLKKRGIDGEVCNVEKNYLKTGKKFDFVVSTEVLEHLDNEDRFIKFMKRYLKKTGVVIITVPDDTLGPEQCHEHKRKYNKESLMKLLKKYFNSVEITSVQKRLVAVCKNDNNNKPHKR